jgi:hypothetical protein
MNRWYVDCWKRWGWTLPRTSPDARSSGIRVESLVEAMKMALKANNPQAAQLVAAECVVMAETKDHQNWELIGQAAEQVQGAEGEALKEVCEQIEDQEDEHLYHSMGWSRELWIDSLGLPAVLPPLEEERGRQNGRRCGPCEEVSKTDAMMALKGKVSGVASSAAERTSGAVPMHHTLAAST